MKIISCIYIVKDSWIHWLTQQLPYSVYVNHALFLYHTPLPFFFGSCILYLSINSNSPPLLGLRGVNRLGLGLRGINRLGRPDQPN